MSTDLDSTQKISSITDAGRTLPVGPPDRSWRVAMAPLQSPCLPYSCRSLAANRAGHAAAFRQRQRENASGSSFTSWSIVAFRQIEDDATASEISEFAGNSRGRQR